MKEKKQKPGFSNCNLRYALEKLLTYYDTF